MANPKRTVLGVEIGAREVRLMEMRGGGNEPQILKAGSVPLPAGSMDGDRIAQVEVVAELIRGLYNRLGCQTRDAILGMGVQNVVTRILAVPRVPDTELRTVIEGELAHYQILRAGMGAFDFFRVDTANAAADASPSVLLMAVEDRIAQSYRLTAEKAGLRMLALEPVTLALFRVAFPRLQAEPAALCLAVTPQRSELSILDHAQIRIYRRLEIGSNDFISGRETRRGGSDPGAAGASADPGGTPARPLGQMLGGEPEDTVDLPLNADMPPLSGSQFGTMGISDYGEIIPQAAAGLATEVQKTLDYYRREFPNATPISRIILTTNDPDAEGLSEWLSHSLRLEVTIASNPTTPNLPPQTAQQLEPPNGLRFLGAAGLAMHALTPDWTQVPRFNLAMSAKGQTGPATDKLTVTAVVSACIVLGGLLFGYLWNRETAKNLQLIADTKNQLAGVSQIDSYKDQARDETTLRGIIKSDNMPIPRLVDIIANALPPEVGMTNIQIDHKGKITLDGKAITYERYYIFATQLEKCASILPPRPIRIETDEKSSIVTYRLESSLKGTHAEKDMLKNPQQ